MQKVEGSSPFIRSSTKGPLRRAFRVLRAAIGPIRRTKLRQHRFVRGEVATRVLVLLSELWVLEQFRKPTGMEARVL